MKRSLLALMCFSAPLTASAEISLDSAWTAAKNVWDSKNSLPPLRPASETGPRIVFSQGRVTYDERELKFDEDIKAWEKIIGMQARGAFGPRSSVWVWDELGLTVSTDSPENLTVKGVNINLADKYPRPCRGLPDDGTSDCAGEKFAPLKNFSGSLLIGGANVDKFSTPREINDRKTERNYWFNCSKGFSSCEAYTPGPGYMMTAWLNADGRKENSPVYYVSFERSRLPE